ncbi:MAG: diguanylate cyclase [Armatimonadota bacterium]
MSSAADETEREELYRSLVEGIQDVLFAVDSKGVFVFVNQRVEELTGYRPDELVGRHFSAVVAAEAMEQTALALLVSDEHSRGPERVHSLWRTRQGETIPVELSVKSLPAPGGPARKVGLARDARDRRELAKQMAEWTTELESLAVQLRETNERLFELAATDQLTGAFNRRVLLQRIREEVSRAARYDGQLSVLFLDIDGFKSCNDEYGHQIGDVVLKRFTELLNKELRTCDSVYRYGGEEFVVLLPETRALAAQTLADRVRDAVARSSLAADETGDGPRITVSIGVTELMSGDEDAERLLTRADCAMYAAKARGGDSVCLASIEATSAAE